MDRARASNRAGGSARLWRRVALPLGSILAALLALFLLLTLLACSAGPRATPTAGPEQAVPLQVVTGARGSVLALVPVFIDGEGPFDFALDTGASQSLVDRQIAERLRLPVVGSTHEITGVAGVTQATTIHLETWRVGDVPLPPATAISLDLPVANSGVGGLRGLLGSDVLSSFGSITIDYQREQLILRSRP